jgi:hypothetical protein
MSIVEVCPAEIGMAQISSEEFGKALQLHFFGVMVP